MSWNLQISGHKDYPDEKTRLEAMRKIADMAIDLLPELNREGCAYANLSHNSGSIDLLQEAVKR